MAEVHKKRLKIGVKIPTLFGQEIEMKNQVKNLGIILDCKLNWNILRPDWSYFCSLAMSESNRKIVEPESKSCVLDIHTDYQTHLYICMCDMVGESASRKRHLHDRPLTEKLKN
jgi:hypothetical protein